MGFFKKEEKALALTTPRERLKREYERTEQKLDQAANRGDLKGVKKAMKEHHKYEYALLNQTSRSSRRESGKSTFFQNHKEF